MDACHLLLGRPWQFDQRTKHDGYKNTYSFYKNDINIVLGPSKGRRMGLLSIFEFIREVEVMKTRFAFMIFEENEVYFDFRQEVHPLLKEFADVISEEISL